MATFRYALAAKEKKRLAIATTGVFDGAVVTLDGSHLATIETTDALLAGSLIPLPDGRVLSVRLVRTILYDWNISIAGMPLPKTTGDIQGAIRGVLIFVCAMAAIQLALVGQTAFAGRLVSGLELVSPLAAILGAVLLWRRHPLVVPVLVLFAVASFVVPACFGYWPWQALLGSAVMTVTAVQAQGLLERERLAVMHATGGAVSPDGVASTADTRARTP